MPVSRPPGRVWSSSTRIEADAWHEQERGGERGDEEPVGRGRPAGRPSRRSKSGSSEGLGGRTSRETWLERAASARARRPWPRSIRAARPGRRSSSPGRRSSASSSSLPSAVAVGPKCRSRQEAGRPDLSAPARLDAGIEVGVCGRGRRQRHRQRVDHSSDHVHSQKSTLVTRMSSAATSGQSRGRARRRRPRGTRPSASAS